MEGSKLRQTHLWRILWGSRFSLTLTYMKAPAKHPRAVVADGKHTAGCLCPFTLCSTMVLRVSSHWRVSPERSQNGGTGGQGWCGQSVVIWQDCLCLLQGFMESADVLHMLFMAWCLASCGTTSVEKKWGQNIFPTDEKTINLWQQTAHPPDMALQIHPHHHSSSFTGSSAWITITSWVILPTVLFNLLL